MCIVSSFPPSRDHMHEKLRPRMWGRPVMKYHLTPNVGWYRILMCVTVLDMVTTRHIYMYVGCMHRYNVCSHTHTSTYMYMYMYILVCVLVADLYSCTHLDPTSTLYTSTLGSHTIFHLRPSLCSISRHFMCTNRVGLGPMLL